MLLLAILILLVTAPAVEAAEAGWKRLEVAATGASTSGGYALRYLPAAVTDNPADPAPLVVFLHGSGATPESWRSLLQPVAEALGCALLVPRSQSTLGFGPGDDEAILRAALALLEDEQPIDSRRRALAGHSSGGAYALELAYSGRPRPAERGWSAVFTLGSPYRTVLELGGPPPPLRMAYGTDDPNFQSAYPALRQQWQRLDIEWEEIFFAGFGHSDWPEDALEDGFAFLLSQQAGADGPCEPTAERLCLRNGRFAVSSTWQDARGRRGVGQVADARSTEDTGLFYFFRDDNWEVLLKILDACSVTGSYWVFSAATTTVEYELLVEDLESGQQLTFSNPLGQRSPAFVDTTTFDACEP
ncbi:MAG: alpha/beta fold hydrolase [Acidobacteriota bacterium]